MSVKFRRGIMTSESFDKKYHIEDRLDIKSKRSNWLGVLGAVSVVALNSVNLHAQQTDAGEELKTNDAEIQEIRVMGSHVKGLDITSTLPVSVLNREDLDTIGAMEGDELLRALPQAGFSQYNGNNSAGGVNEVRGDIASINLRGIGTGNSLMLLNGRRMVMHPGFANEDGVPVVSPNMNAIPVGAVQSLQVLRDGASALYGADAVAGVINNVLRNDFEGTTIQTRYGGEENSERYDSSFSIGSGFKFNDDATKLAIFGDYSRRASVESSEYEQSLSGDNRRLLEGTAWEGSTDFDNRSSSTAWGGFQALTGDSFTSGGYVKQDGVNITASDGGFHIQPNEHSGCKADLGNGICIDDSKTLSGSSDRAQYYDYEANRQMVPKRERGNFFTTLNHEFDGGTEFYAEGSGYYAQTNRFMEHPTVLSTARFTIPKENYWNPFGAVTLADGSVNPNRLADLDIPDEGVDVLMYAYRAVDAGRRESTITNKSYRILAGVNGVFGDWDYDSAVLYSMSSSDDLTEGGVLSTLFQKALSLNTPDAYNPFNGTGGSIKDDLTPNPQNVIGSIQGDVTKYGKTTLTLADFKISNPAVFSMIGGDAAFAFGVESRRETFLDNRGSMLDGTAPFVDSLSGAYSQSNSLGNSPTNDSAGSRTVNSVFGELILPIVSPEMDIPLVDSLNVQLAARYESFSDAGDILKPRIAVSWGISEDLSIRAAYSEGFRAPNLIQINDTGLSRINDAKDFYRCQAQVSKGIYTDETKCNSVRFERFSAGNKDLNPEDSENTSMGIAYSPSSLPGLVITADYWQVEQDNLVGLFGGSNWSQLDRILRGEGSSSANVIREAVSDEDRELYEGTGQEAVGMIKTILDPYANLNKRTVSGADYSVNYDFDTQDLGSFKLKFNVARLIEFEQKVGNEGKTLIDNGVEISGLGDLVQKNGRPEARYTAHALWRKDNWGAGLYGRYVGDFYDTSAKIQVDDETVYWRIPSYTTVNGTVDYFFKDDSALNDTRLRVGVKNIFDKSPPLADEGFGFFHKLHSITGRYIYVDLLKKF
jgi:iron complex outermembrane recepter protein